LNKIVLAIKNTVKKYYANRSPTAVPAASEATSGQTGKSQCLANPSVPLWLADEKSRIY
jgi:hypothetical protein